jgi:hypothetical protein
MDKAVERFIGYTMGRLIKHGTKVTLYPTFKTPDGCGGSFGEIYEGQPCEFDVATGKDMYRWLGVYVHEYSHFLQHIAKEPLYVNSDGPVTRFFEYLEKERRRFTWADVRAVQALERDCEIRAVRLIKYHELPLDLDDYIQQANAQILFYNEAARKQSWVVKKGRFPYNVKACLDLMPTTIQKEEWYHESPEGFAEVCEEYCFSKRPESELR